MRSFFVRLLPWALCALLAAAAWTPDAAAVGTAPVAKDPPVSAGAGTSRSVSRAMRAAARTAQATRLQQTSPLTLTTATGAIGEPIYASATIKNVSASPVSIKVLVAAGRGPGVPDWDCGTLDWSSCGADFEPAADLVLQPGQEHAYREVRVPAARGDYWAEMTFQDATTLEWQSVGGSNRVRYTARGGELAVVQPLVLNPASPRPGQVVTATARVKNVGDLALPMRYLSAAGRGPDCTTWDCDNWNWEKIADFTAAEDVVLEPGQEYLYYGLTTGRARGGYFAEMAYKHAKVDAWRMGLSGTNRVTYAVACDARCEQIRAAYRDVVGREPDTAGLRAAYDSSLDGAALRAFLCGAPDRRPAACGAASLTPLQRFLAYLPLNSRR